MCSTRTRRCAGCCYDFSGSLTGVVDDWGDAIGWAANLGTGRLVTHFMAISHAVADDVRRVYRVPPQRVSVIYRGLEPSWLVPESPECVRAVRRALAPPDAFPILITVGRLVAQKGQQYVIQAMWGVLARFPGAYLWLVGDGPLRDTYLALAEGAGVSGRISFLGTRRDVKLLLHAADIFVFPSVHEGLGVAMLEAMAVGRPIVAANIPALREVTGGAAVLVPPRHADALGDAIVALAERPEEWAVMGAHGQKTVRTRFDIGRNADAFAALCMRLTTAANRHVTIPG